MHFNEKKKQDSDRHVALPTPFHSIDSFPSFDNKRLNPIDVLFVDKQSRLTLTRKVKRVIPLNPGDKIAVYQDIYNKDVVLRLQNHKAEYTDEKEVEKKVDHWVLTIKRGLSGSPGNRTLMDDKDKNVEKKPVEDQKYNKHDQSDEKTESSPRYRLKDSETTLLDTPILLVDDELELLSIFKLLLKHEGYKNISTFSSSKATLKYLLNLTTPSEFKIAIIDIRMPDVNGLQLYQILKILNPSIRVLFFTALDAVDELISVYAEIKPIDILRKPLDSRQFIRAVNDKIFELSNVY